MQIFWHGQTCFKIVIQNGKNGNVVVLIDPFDKETGLKPPRIEADILLFAGEEKKPAPENVFSVTGPGEYDVKGIYIRGFPALSRKDNGRPAGASAIYTIEGEDIKICHLGKISSAEIGSKDFEQIGDVDILMLPVGGSDAIDAKEAIKIMSQIEPKITIPMYYKVPGLKAKLDDLEKFLRSLGVKKMEQFDKLSIKKKDLSEDEAKIFILKP